jgi:hypothetical protein
MDRVKVELTSPQQAYQVLTQTVCARIAELVPNNPQ